MKTKEEMQAIVLEIREVCKLHGIVILPGGLDGIVLCESAQVKQTPSVLHKSIDDETMMLTNQVQEHPERTTNFAHEVDHFSIFGIGDVEGITKPRIVISQYSPQRDTNLTGNAMVVDVDNLDQVENVIFVKPFIAERYFVKLGIELDHGPFGVLMAYYENHEPMVVGFIEGVSHQELRQKWPEDLRKEDSNGPAA
jgi:hypothetical protein